MEIVKEFISVPLLKGVIASVLTGVVASVLTVWFTRKNLRTTKYIDTITAERIKWIQIVRNDFNELIASMMILINNSEYLRDLKNEKIRQEHTEYLVGAYRESTDEDLQEFSELSDNIVVLENEINKVMTRSEIANKALLIKLKMNPEDDIEIIADLDKIVTYFSNYSNDIKKFDLEINSTVDKVQRLLKREWDKVKIEVKKK
jgi:hypothetical protein